MGVHGYPRDPPYLPPKSPPAAPLSPRKDMASVSESLVLLSVDMAHGHGPWESTLDCGSGRARGQSGECQAHPHNERGEVPRRSIASCWSRNDGWQLLGWGLGARRARD
eukprot:scaffold49018_cov39-Tisochrysis_lutea.AAC.2